jgi:biotin carboxyl carrier protein
MSAKQNDTPDELVVDDTVYETRLTWRYRQRRGWTRRDERRITSHIPGLVLKVEVRPGQPVRRGDPLLVLEAMKMQNEVVAPCDAQVKAVHVDPNQRVAKNELLIELE